MKTLLAVLLLATAASAQLGPVPGGGGSSGISGATNKGAMYATGATTGTSTGALTDGQLLIGSSSGNPAAATLTGGTGISITNGANSIQIDATGSGGGNCNSGLATCVPIANDAAGTTNNLVAKWANNTVNGGKIKTAATTDFTSAAPIVGIVVSGAGTSGNAMVAIAGQVSCQLDNTVGGITIGQTVQTSSNVAGDCAPLSTPGNEDPQGHFILGTAISTTAAGGVATVLVDPTMNAYFSTGGATPILLAGNGYGGRYLIPSLLSMTGPWTNPSHSSTTVDMVMAGNNGAGLRWSDPSTGVTYTRFNQCGGGTWACGASNHDFLFDVSSHESSNSAMFRFNGAQYQVPKVQSVSGTLSAGANTNVGANSGLYIYTMTGNTTLSSLTNDNTGDVLTFEICANASGPWTFTWPANFRNLPIQLTGAIPASTCYAGRFLNDGTNYNYLGAGSVTNAAALTSTAIMTGAGANAAQTPSATATLDSSGNMSLPGTLAVTGHLTFEGVTSTGATGTGKLVFDTSPTISNPTVTGGITVGGSTLYPAKLIVCSAGGTGCGATPGDFTTSGVGTNFETITGLSYNLPANLATSTTIDCHLAYVQNTANANISFSLQSATVAATNVQAECMWNNSGTTIQPSTGQFASTTTATQVCSAASPADITAVRQAHIFANIEGPSNASQATINVGVKTATAADTVTIKRGSYCVVR